MDDELKELHGIFQRLVDLHKHLERFQEQPPVDYVQMVSNTCSRWTLQKNFVNKEEQAFQQMETIVGKLWIDFGMAGFLTK